MTWIQFKYFCSKRTVKITKYNLTGHSLEISVHLESYYPVIQVILLGVCNFLAVMTLPRGREVYNYVVCKTTYIELWSTEV